MDETRIDAAPTPAHVFAYRAFRSVFVRSPDSSPVRPQSRREYGIFDYEQDREKENIRSSPARPSRFVTSPVKTKRKDGEINAPGFDQELKLTPKRQKTVPVSPTKSILKNPHAPTPRRAELRDVTVTFKDLRKSMSPEASRGLPVRVRSQPAMRTLLEDIAQQKTMPTVETKTALVPRVPAPAIQPKVSTQDSGFDLDKYKAQTEKEMRRLIKYGQKWKEQARRQDEENAKLRSLLEETRKENERLQKKIVQVQETKESEMTRSSLKPTAKEAEQSKKRSEIEANVQGTPKIDPKHRPQQEYSRPKTNRQSSLQQKMNELEELQPSPPNNHTDNPPQDTEQRPRQQSLKKKIDLLKDATTEKERDSLHKAQAERENVLTTKQPVDLASNEQSLEQDVQKLSLPVRTASLSAAEDRKVAARERLRLKREARAASSQAILSAEDKQKKVHESSKLEIDESQFDWAAMA
ncbi:hypothetical protein PMZ80_002037 [Knufia obscura]|uniref:Spindle pole body-associated protein cut12 domain-containing protein n=2 Tax=Knufia TaxID=430999 RepID=A0AAN8EEP0_9EURO|nr:hypothetical protein PMZ80_002037 [Knufia obscura]KAK5953853.1 hypothetical protein OHC33_005123 [Knufia fluminis]